MRRSCASTKCKGLSYPTHFLKSRGSVIRNHFLECKTKQATLFARRNYFYALFATNKAKHILDRHFSCSCSDRNYSKSIKKKSKKVPFLEVFHFSITCSQHFLNVSRASSDRIFQ